MKFTDIFIRRPVLATVLSLFILVLGLRSIGLLPVLQFPRTENAVVTVTTAYTGADADVVAGFITTPAGKLHRPGERHRLHDLDEHPGAEHDHRQPAAQLTITDKALTEISTKVSAVRNQLPPDAQQPVMSVKVGQTIDAMYIGFSSPVLESNKITDYLTRVVQPKLQAVDGVQTAEILGDKLLPCAPGSTRKKLAAYGLTASDVGRRWATTTISRRWAAPRGRWFRST